MCGIVTHDCLCRLEEACIGVCSALLGRLVQTEAGTAGVEVSGSVQESRSVASSGFGCRAMGENSRSGMERTRASGPAVLGAGWQSGESASTIVFGQRVIPEPAGEHGAEIIWT